MAAAAANALLAAPAFAEAGKIFDFNLTLPIMAGQFLALMVVMDALVYKPVGKVLDERDADLRKKVEAVKDNSTDVAKFTVRKNEWSRLWAMRLGRTAARRCAPPSLQRGLTCMLSVEWSYPARDTARTRLLPEHSAVLPHSSGDGPTAREILTINVPFFSQDEAEGIIRAARNDAAAEVNKAKTAAEAEAAKKIAAAKVRTMKKTVAAKPAPRSNDRAVISTRKGLLNVADPRVCRVVCFFVNLQAKLDAELKSALAALEAQKAASLSTLDAEVRKSHDGAPRSSSFCLARAVSSRHSWLTLHALSRRRWLSSARPSSRRSSRLACKASIGVFWGFFWAGRCFVGPGGVVGGGDWCFFFAGSWLT